MPPEKQERPLDEGKVTRTSLFLPGLKNSNPRNGFSISERGPGTGSFPCWLGLQVCFTERTLVHTRTHAHTRTRTRLHTRTLTYTQTHTHTHAHTHARTQTRTHTHKHTHTHTHTHTLLTAQRLRKMKPFGTNSR